MIVNLNEPNSVSFESLSLLCEFVCLFLLRIFESFTRDGTGETGGLASRVSPRGGLWLAGFGSVFGGAGIDRFSFLVCFFFLFYFIFCKHFSF